MVIRTSRETIRFVHPFEIDGFDGLQPAGDYRLDTEEEVIEGLSFLAYRRVAAVLYLPAATEPQTRVRAVTLLPSALDALREIDGASA